MSATPDSRRANLRGWWENWSQPSGKAMVNAKGKLDTEMMKSVATQLMGGKTVELAGHALAIEKIGARRLRLVKFEMNGGEYEAIEQNPSKPSNWGKLARQGHQVVQFRDIGRNKYVAVAVDGEIREYGKMRK